VLSGGSTEKSYKSLSIYIIICWYAVFFLFCFLKRKFADYHRNQFDIYKTVSYKTRNSLT